MLQGKVEASERDHDYHMQVLDLISIYIAHTVLPAFKVMKLDLYRQLIR